MYRTCIYCQRNLGENESVENFPVGRRLAFDSSKGRLWVICERCRRWNLSPLDERWEAIEECERYYRDTRLRFSTGNIGLARLKEGTDLVRIGRPKRPEFAAWRYGTQFIKRRVKRLILAGVQAVGYTASAFAGMLLFYLTDDNARVVARVRDEHGRRLPIVRRDLKGIVINSRAGAAGWSLTVPFRPVERFKFLFGARGTGERQTVELSGGTAIRAAGRILPRLNSFGGTKAQVRNAVGLIEEVGDPEEIFAHVPEIAGRARITTMNAETRLALEMAAHEGSERRALEGELDELEAAWREAEEIAAISDRLLIPKGIEDWIIEQKRRLSRDRADEREREGR